MLRHPRAVRIVWVRNSADIDAPQPNYRLLHWRNPHINGVGFAELNGYDIHGLSAIISRTVPHNISKNNTLRPVGPVRLTPGTSEC